MSTPQRTRTRAVSCAVFFLAVLTHLASPKIYARESESVFNLAERFFSDSLYAIALEHYQKYLSLDRSPEHDAVAYYKSALCNFHTGNMRNAITGFEEFLNRFPADTRIMDAMFLAGVAHREAENYTRASEWFFRVWTQFTGSAKAREALFQAAVCAEKAKDTRRAIRLFDQFIRKFPSHSNAKQAIISLASLQLHTGQHTEAGKTLHDAVNLFSDDNRFQARRHFLAGQLAQIMQQKDLALEEYRQMHQLNVNDFPEIIEAFQAYSTLLMELEKFNGVLSLFESMQTIYRKRNETPPLTLLIDRAEAARKSGRFRNAEEYFAAVLRVYPETAPRPLIRYRIAECQASYHVARAIETLQSIASDTAAGDYSWRARLKIGDLYYTNELYTSAISAYRSYLQSNAPHHRDRLLFRIGTMYKDNFERYNAALNEFELLAKQYPASSYIHRAVYAIAECYEKLGNYRAAQRSYEYLIESGAPPELADTAGQRIMYLSDFFITDSESAALKMLDLVVGSAHGNEPWYRLLTGAEICERHLKQFDKALIYYDTLLSGGMDIPDSLGSVIRYRRGVIFEKCASRASIEHDDNTARYFREKALSTYRSLVASKGAVDLADDAAYRIMLLTSPGIEAYEKFLSSYPRSNHRADVYYAVARYYETQAKNTDDDAARKAIDSYGILVHRFPSDPRSSAALIGMARNYLALNLYDSAGIVINRILNQDDASDLKPEATFLQGKLFLRRHDYEQAAAAFQKVVYHYPFSPLSSPALLELAQAQLETREILEALQNFRRYLSKTGSPDEALEARYGEARCLVAVGKYQDAAQKLEILLENDLKPSLLAGVHRELGIIAREQGEPYTAITHFEKALATKAGEKRRDILLAMGTLYFRYTMFDKAVETYSSVLPLLPSGKDSIDAMVGYINALTMSGRSRKADNMTGIFKKRFPGNEDQLARIVYYEGLHLQREEKFDKAVQRFTYITTRFSHSEYADDAAYQKAYSYFRAGENTNALDEFRTVLSRYPTSDSTAAARFTMGMIFHSEEDFAQAANYFSTLADDTVINRDLRFTAIHNAAVAFKKIAGWQDAARMYTLLLHNFPDRIEESRLNLNIGFCLVQGSRFEEALTFFDAANRNPAEEDKPEIIYWKAVCYSKLGDYRRAIAEYLKVPYLYEGVGKWGVTAELEAARLYERLEDFGKARSLYTKVLQADGETGKFGKQASIRLRHLKNLQP